MRTCRKCGAVKALTDFTVNKKCRDGRTHTCKSCWLAYLREWGTEPRSKELRHGRHVRYIGKLRVEGGERLEHHRLQKLIVTKRRMKNSEWDQNYRREYKRRFYQNHRVLAIMRYGGRCVCCNEDTIEFLTLDHINGGGHADRHRTKGDWHLRVSRGRLRDDIRVLCYNCNCGRERNGGICPHESKLRLVVNHGS